MPSIIERLDAIGAGAVIILGLILLFFPEPSTSVIGGLMVLVGLALGFSQWRKTKQAQPIGEDVSVSEAQTPD